VAKSTTSTKKNSATDSSKQLSTEELREYYAKTQAAKLKFDEALSALQMIDPNKNYSKTYTTFSKETFRTYMQNPLSNAKNLRALSRFLYYRNQVYKRLVNYYANMIDLRYRSVIPLADITKGVPDSKKMIKSYYDTLLALENSGIEGEFQKVFVHCHLYDTFYGICFVDEETGGWFIYPLPMDYCKIVGVESDGSYAAVMDMTYWRSYEEIVELIGDPISSMYSAYGGDNNKRYQPIPSEYSVVIKYDSYDWENSLPPHMAMFNSLINLSDMEDIQAIADELQIQDLLVATIPLLKNVDEPNEFSVDPELAIKYFNMMKENLNANQRAVITPVPLEKIGFDKDAASDVNSYQRAMNAVYVSSGGGQILNTGKITSSSAFKGAIKADEDVAISSLLPQVERTVNRILSYRISNPAKVKFLEVTTYTVDDYKASLLQSAQYGLPVKTMLNTLNGVSELETISMAHLENALGLTDLFVPMKSSNTMNTGDLETGGAPKKEDGDLSDEGEETRDKDKNDK